MDKIAEIIAARQEYWKRERIIQNILNERARKSLDKTQNIKIKK